MTERLIPPEQSIFYRVRVMDEDAGTFKNCWQHLIRGDQSAIVDADMNPITLPVNHSVIFLDSPPAPHFLPGIEKDPDPADTARRYAEQAAALEAAQQIAAAAAATAATGGAGGTGTDSVAGSVAGGDAPGS